jgi:hypothetical protein
VAFTPGRNPKQMAESVVRHGPAAALAAQKHS